MELYIQSKGDNDSQQIGWVIERYLAQARTRPELTNITSTYNAAAQVLRLDVDRAKAETLGVAVEDVYGTMQTMFGSMFVSQFTRFSRLFQVIIQGEPASRLTPKDIDYVYVRGRNGTHGSAQRRGHHPFRPGAGCGDAFQQLHRGKSDGRGCGGVQFRRSNQCNGRNRGAGLAHRLRHSLERTDIRGKRAGGSSMLVMVFGLIMVFLILAGQYEKWSLPLGVLGAVPFALFGALLAIFVRGLSNDIYFQIGLTMLIALAAKNAILIFEYAVANREAGQSIYDAAINAARDRLRPIIMTSLAFTLGCVPLAIATGAVRQQQDFDRHGRGRGHARRDCHCDIFHPNVLLGDRDADRKNEGQGQCAARGRSGTHGKKGRGSRRGGKSAAGAAEGARRMSGTARLGQGGRPRVPASCLMFLFLALALGGCMVGPDYRQPQVEVMNKYRFDDQTSRDIAGNMWWEQFRDPVMNDLIRVALDENKDIRVAAGRIEEFQGRFGATRSQLFPQLGSNAGAERLRSPFATSLPEQSGLDSFRNVYELSINANWELDIWGRIRRLTEAARAQLFASEAGRRATILTLVSSVASSSSTCLYSTGSLKLPWPRPPAEPKPLRYSSFAMKAASFRNLNWRRYNRNSRLRHPQSRRSRQASASRKMRFPCFSGAIRAQSRAGAR